MVDPIASDLSCDVIVVGGGNAGLSAALAARDAGASVVLLERAPIHERGGNTAFTDGAVRVAYRGVEEVAQLVSDLSSQARDETDFGSYDEDQFLEDMARVTNYRCDPDLTEILVRGSFDTFLWMKSKGVQFLPIYGRQAFKVDGRFRFWGGLTIEASGGGPGLVNALFRAAKQRNVRIFYGARAMEILRDVAGLHGVRVSHGGRSIDVHSKKVVLASGGFEANVEWRTRYLGPGWDLARVRGTRFNTGDGLRMALEVDAMPYGNWSGCHAVAWDLNAPEYGDLRLGGVFQRHSYPFGIVVNADGRRFLDEGADFRNYTYAKYGRLILEQPSQLAWQVFDSKVSHLLREEYRTRYASKVEAESLESLARKLDGVNEQGFLATVREFNSAVQSDVQFDPNVKDGRGTSGLTVPKSNWANTVDTPPFEAYPVTCGITFTFGGLRVTKRAEVLDTDQNVIPGLYACGEVVGGLFYLNYPGGAGLTSGAVFGKIAGQEAGKSG